jgi:hypothetical protein
MSRIQSPLDTSPLAILVLLSVALLSSRGALGQESATSAPMLNQALNPTFNPAVQNQTPPTAITPPSGAKVNTSVPSQLVGEAVDYKRFRDPFKEPEISEEMLAKSDLERYSVTDFKVTGIITGPIRMRAMVMAPDGKTHYVSEKMKMGTRDGMVTKITTKTLVVREKVLNPLGEVEIFETEIGMDHKASETEM